MSMADRDGKIWMDGALVDWRDAKIHVLSHTLHYGCGAFEGVRAYNTVNGTAIFRLREHTERLFNSAKIFMMEIPFSQDEICEAQREVVRANKLDSCYLRPLVFYGSEKMGVSPRGASVRVAIAAWPWGAYLGEEGITKGIRVKTSSFQRHHINVSMVRSKTAGHYVNSILANQEALNEGYDEAPWPNNPNLPPKPDGYPIEPGQINSDEWVRGNSGINGGSGVKAELDYHIQYRTEMILPIHDYDDGNGINGNYHITRLGSFLLLGYNLTGQGWMDLVYIGNAAECPALVTPPSRTINPGLIGQVFHRPRYKLIPSSRPPVAYQIILGVPGSMTWKFDGYGWKNGKATLCTGANAGCSGADAWPDKTLRRIYIAKQAMKAFIDQMGTNDTMRIITFSGNLSGSYSNQNAINKLTEALPSTGWSSDG